MSHDFGALPAELTQTHPGLGLLRFAALLGESGDGLDDEAWDDMRAAVEAGVLIGLKPSKIWPELAHGLMAGAPSRMIEALRACGALAIALPEVDALFGVPQIADDPPQVDLGAHLMKALDEAAKRGAPLSVRFSLLVMNVGKSDSPREHLPSHYRHIERGGPRIRAICARFQISEDCRALALLALAECERVHRASEVRAGPVALMLERLGAFDAPENFALLMSICACDYCAYGERSGGPYPKAELLTAALNACAGIGLASDQGGLDSAEAVQTARAAAIAKAFGSQRWSGKAE
ncbi:tRNA nucleotidyltransferase/poly(A) polymerase family protein [Methylocella silvestris BL2]|uniref:tRNA nucleotidyltransferase/poly(A) polymerase family protein n=1 Tax=Methylocella silvestris (strain DSM 15510 / CIP 108128 / LMG 27833 / NCIMB 13906 / BL2) TaxID=395965 RepID=B8ESM4_METSB|nr:tRNA nucleotidyltransferase [Methylocella silvestris]ACK50359.1 tRNA nucleotidyltransferase/poly(A) polymerase family protein [Methylocella silvestris BL2]